MQKVDHHRVTTLACVPPPTVLALSATLLLSVCLNGCTGFSDGLNDPASPPSSAATAAGAIGSADPGRFSSLVNMTVADPSTYKIGGGDVLDVSVFQIQDLTRSVQVAANGTISLPLIGIVQAGGRTAQQVEGEIASKLRAKYVQSPQ